MFDIQKSKQLWYPGATLAPQQEEMEAYTSFPANSCPPPLPALDPTPVLALLAWAVRTAQEHGILNIVEQSTARSSFLAAVQAAEAFLSQEAGPGAPVRWESERPWPKLWPTATGEPTWFSPVLPRRRKVSLLCLGKYDNAQRAQPQLPTVRALSISSLETNGCQFDGQRWTLRFAGKTVTQRNLKGWRYLAFLLQRPREEIHVLDLLQLTDAQPGNMRAGLTGASADHLAAQGLCAIRGLDERITIDATARTAYRQRWMELQSEFEEAERFNDSARAAKVRAEMEFLVTELTTGYGYRTHPCSTSEAAEKARKAVTNRIRDAVAKLQPAHPALWRHLSTFIKTGTFCSYQPTPPTTWKTTEKAQGTLIL